MPLELDYNYDDFESGFTFKNLKHSSCGCGTFSNLKYFSNLSYLINVSLYRAQINLMIYV